MKQDKLRLDTYRSWWRTYYTAQHWWLILQYIYLCCFSIIMLLKHLLDSVIYPETYNHKLKKLLSALLNKTFPLIYLYRESNITMFISFRSIQNDFLNVVDLYKGLHIVIGSEIINFHGQVIKTPNIVPNSAIKQFCSCPQVNCGWKITQLVVTALLYMAYNED